MFAVITGPPAGPASAYDAGFCTVALRPQVPRHRPLSPRHHVSACKPSDAGLPGVRLQFGESSRAIGAHSLDSIALSARPTVFRGER